nr:ARF guanine-nucleotide exchange factor GNL2 [Tanacetum cinerariifolium]
VALRNSPVDKNMRIMDLMADSVKLIVEWQKNGYSDPGSNASINSTATSTLDDMLEYSTRENAERETRSMEGTLMLSMEFLVDVYLQFLKLIIESVGFKTFWLGILRRMDTCMKADLGVYGESKTKELVPRLLTKMITTMQEKELLVPQEGNDLWEVTYIQIQWIAPSLKDELFPDATG